ncbi:hypothetical protein OK074_3643 [Actinobacteria bacterium OK074]|nr:hypothetical protein OK074_3643 [Actinobacteria bacterium OK074]
MRVRVRVRGAGRGPWAVGGPAPPYRRHTRVDVPRGYARVARSQPYARVTRSGPYARVNPSSPYAVTGAPPSATVVSPDSEAGSATVLPGRWLKSRFSTIAVRQPALIPLFMTVWNQSGNRA